MPTTVQTGTFVETRIALSDLAATGAIGVTALMLNEAATVEATHAGVPTGTFTDGYHMSIPMTRWLAIDRSLSASPNAASRLRP